MRKFIIRFVCTDTRFPVSPMVDRDQLSLTAMPSDLLLRLLKQNGAQYATEEALAADREAGAPIADDGTVNLVAYAAWLARRMAHGA